MHRAGVLPDSKAVLVLRSCWISSKQIAEHNRSQITSYGVVIPLPGHIKHGMAAIRQKTNFIKHDDLPIHNKQLHSLGTGSNTLLMSSMLASGSARTVTMRTMRWMETRFVNGQTHYGGCMPRRFHTETLSATRNHHFTQKKKLALTVLDRAWPCNRHPPIATIDVFFFVFMVDGQRFGIGISWPQTWWLQTCFNAILGPQLAHRQVKFFGNQKMNYPHLVPLAEFPYLQPKFLAYVISRHVSS